MPRRPPRGDGIDAIARRIDKQDRRSTLLEQPDYGQLGKRLEQLGDLITDLATTISTGSVVASGSITAGGSLSVTGNIGVGAYLFTPAGYSFDITYTRRTAWLGNDGRLGWASSSITAKEIVDTIEQPDAVKILEITSHYYERKAEIAKRDDPDSSEYRGPDYHVALEWGAIAEQLHDLGLWQAVIYEWDVEYDLVDVLDDSGQPILNEQGYHLKERTGEPRRVGSARPVGIHYELLGLLAIRATRWVWEQQKAFVDEVRPVLADVAAIKLEVAELRKMVAD